MSRQPSRPRDARLLVDAACAGACVVVALLFVLARADLMPGGVSGLPNFGRAFVAQDAPERALVTSPQGYDGQFFYQLARDPLPDATNDGDIRFDTPAYRAQRAGYPALAWLVSRTGVSTAWALVLVNLLAVGIIAFLGMRIARAVGAPAVAGLALAVSPAIAESLARDTSESTALALMSAGLLAVLRERPWVAAAALTAAGLVRETTLVLAAGLLLAAVMALVRSRTRNTVMCLVAAALPPCTWVLWQLVQRGIWGEWAFLASRGPNFGLPFHGLSTMFGTSWGVSADVAALLLVYVLPLVAVGFAVRTARGVLPAAIPAALGLATTLSICLSPLVCGSSPGRMRATLQTTTVALVVLCSHRRAALAAAATVACCAVMIGASLTLSLAGA